MSDSKPQDAVEFHLKCPSCFGRMFQRDMNRFYRFEEEVCENCGTHCRVEIQGDAQPFACKMPGPPLGD